MTDFELTYLWLVLLLASSLLVHTLMGWALDVLDQRRRWPR